MLAPFFAAAMRAPGRHLGFRRAAAAHVGLLTAAGLAAGPAARTNLGYAVLVLGIVEGAFLVGWRLTQLPKSPALEFLLTSPVQPRRLFLAEALVGAARFALVWLAGLPVFVGMILAGVIEPADLAPLAGLPFAWGLAFGLGLTAWVYEPPAVRRVGELFALAGVLVYLVVGVVAGENLRLWLAQLPDDLGTFLLSAVLYGHNMNPFGVVRYWFGPDRVAWVAWERVADLSLVALGVAGAAGLRAAGRLRGHFHDRHYRPIRSGRPDESGRIADRPLSWWAVRRVMEYSGRVNLWLAGGFCLLYAAFIVAGDAWPAWMGRLVFQLFEGWGGPASVATAMAVLATVPAVFQYGLWDATVPDRCKRLELLLLTDLEPADYCHAALAAAWARGRGYLLAAGVLWLALGLSGRNTWAEVAGAAAGGAVLWGLAFAVGFRSFSTGAQTSGIASLFVLGLPLLLFGLLRLGWAGAAAFVPTGLCHLPLTAGPSPTWAAAAGLWGAAGVWLVRRGLARCDGDLRRWYDRHQGRKSVE